MRQRDLGKTGLKVSVLGFGASPLGGEFGAIDEAEGIRAVHRSIDLGINFFDTAPFYGRTRSETVLGHALEGRRHEVVLATKVGRYGKTDFDFRPETILPGLDASLTRLKTDHVDVVYVHDIEFGDLDPILSDTIPALVKAKEQGKVRAIGVSGLPLAILEAAVQGCELDLILSYCHYHLADQTLMQALAPMVRQRGMGLVNAAPLAMGLLTQPGPPAWHPAPEALKSACRMAAHYCTDHGVDLADLALDFAIKSELIDSTVVGMSTVAEVERNVAAISTRADMSIYEALAKILAPVSGVTWPSGKSMS